MNYPVRHPMYRYGCVILLLVLVTGCRQIPDGIEPVTAFELDRYLGTWYEIARLDHWFERDLIKVTATYSLRDDGSVDVLNRGYDTGEEEWTDARGRAVFVASPDVGQLKVSFFRPFYGGYNIIELDHEHYSWALVCGPSHSYLWILSREPELDQDITDRLIARAEKLGFDTDALIFVEQGDTTLSRL